MFHAHAAEAFNTLVAPAISCGCEVWGLQSHERLDADANKLRGGQLAFLLNVRGCMHPGVPVPASLALMAQDPSRSSWILLMLCHAFF